MVNIPTDCHRDVDSRYLKTSTYLSIKNEERQRRIILYHYETIL